MNFTKQIKINASAEKVWEVLGRGFADVGVWSTGVFHSVPNDKASRVNNSPVGGRLCDTTFGKISEEFTAYDDEGKSLSFKGVIESKMFKSVISTNEVTPIDANTSEVNITPQIELTVLGTLMSPLIKMQLNKAIDQILSDLKYYVENGKPSPTKLAEQQKK